MTLATLSPDHFDPAAWLKALTTIGGGYALTPGRRLVLLVASCDGEDLGIVMSHVIGRHDRQEAVIAAIERHQAGEA